MKKKNLSSCKKKKSASGRRICGMHCFKALRDAHAAKKLRTNEEREKEHRLYEQRERRDHEEYLLLKEAFTVEEEGEAGVLFEQEAHKMVALEELVAQFYLRVQEGIKRLEDLQEVGRITGVMDDRGKFSYSSQQELEDVVQYVKQRGRVAITELAKSSSSLISLKSSESDINNKLLEVS